ncbi:MULTISPECIES: LOG family protein [Arthrospira]|uniref:LOG family protein n=1 Tax=Limnospira platensis NIES-46 TaxID=1236695 RepID=A0A5M3T3U7_LIMPL|nr:LOG family protein [Arthrospira platensis]AMW31643.1 cytochrome D ubiquinol oxidase subunit II [Arthrospira platensis YZ]MBD2668306.1 LOG family protein [Arthrospira platensis FACHB-439]MBD2709500.1 LOG family protein [Arthrospira platensis FACHB-835]MDF2210318.1 LOG family protein [Arthrospira platensis NCB002]MDT9181806.1 LOG family protein [Limnospira sp. PMC 289.06]MDT9293982.1 LOG family protein [Arthrospira platensis PCC 7345]QQW32043.1 LOG family protein [Arthrospira sp. PCC 9108]
MNASGNGDTLASLKREINQLIDELPALKHEKWIVRSLSSLVRIAQSDIESLDWKILSSAVLDMEQGFEIFYPYRHIRKICIFGSARTSPTAPEYDMAVELARAMTQQGFMVLTGAGGGIMEAANLGAGAERSFGLNIKLPFEQFSNPYIEGDPKLIKFKYFFTRKLFFLRESDALAMFPGGFGTLDETWEGLTLAQTGKFGPAPVILIDHPGGDYWYDWQEFVRKQLLRRGFISQDDPSIYTITDDLAVAEAAIADFYQVYHSSRYVGDLFVMRLNSELSDEQVEYLNQEFKDILSQGRIEKSRALPKELGDETEHLPRLVFYFNQRDVGRLYLMIAAINKMGENLPGASHPEQK